MSAGQSSQATAGKRRCTRVPPGGDDLDVGLETVEGELEADLVVTLAGAAVGDEPEGRGRKKTTRTVGRVSDRSGGELSVRGATVDSLAVLLLGDLHHAAGNDGASERGAEEVNILVDG